MPGRRLAMIPWHALPAGHFLFTGLEEFVIINQ
jgi:hypothetical protein